MSEFPKRGQSCQGTDMGYTVEARMNCPTPNIIAGRVFDNRWRTVYFDKSPVGFPGVPIGGRLTEFAIPFGLMSYNAAQALRYWFIAFAETQDHAGICLETRLVTHAIKFNVSEESTGAIEAFDFRGDPVKENTEEKSE